MRTQMMGLALAATALTVVAGCGSGGTTTTTAGASAGPSAGGALGSAPSASPSESSETTTDTGGTTGKTTATTKPATTTTTTAAVAGPEIVYFKIAQKPRCAEGTDVYQNPAVPLIIKWKIAHAKSGALSVDDKTHTAGTYGQVGLTGSEEFFFSCAGAVGDTETHTYAIYSVGGGTQHSKSLTVTTKVLDKGTTVS